MNFREWLKSKSEYLIAGAIVVCVLITAMILCPPYYSMNDDVMMRSILSGGYTGTPDGHAVYMKYPLTGALSLLYRVTNIVPWFDLFMVSCFAVAVTAVIVRVRRVLEPLKERRVLTWGMMAGICILLFALFLPQLFALHYTLVAAMVGSCGLFLLLTGGGAISVVLLILCYCIRSQIFFLLLPFMLVVVLWNVLDKQYRPMCRYLIALVIGITVCMGWNGFMYRSSEWKAYAEYNDSRTILYDYDKLLPYEENAEAFERIGISEQQHKLMDEYMLVLAQDVTPEIMSAAAELTASKRAAQQNFTERLIYCIKEYYYHLRYNDTPYKIVFLCGCLAVLVLLVKKRQWLKAGLLGCMLGGRSLIWIYLIWRSRFPERIYVSLYFMDIMIFAGMFINLLRRGCVERKTDKQHTKWLCIGCGVLISIVLLVTGISQCVVMCGRAKTYARNHEEWTALTEYCREHPETNYLVDVYSTVDYSGKVWESIDDRENYLLAGGWMTKSPLLMERVKALKTENCGYIIAADRNADWLFTYCEQRLNGVQIEKTDSISLGGKALFYVYRPIVD